MKVSPDIILLENLRELNLFIEELKLEGILKFEESIVDNSGNILIKEHIPVKGAALERLGEMEGSYKPLFKIKVDKELLGQIRELLSRSVVDILKLPESDFIAHLYRDLQSNYPKIILHSFSNSHLILAIYNAFKTNRAFFNHVASLALLTLAIMIQHPVRIRMIHRYAFLAGLICDLIFMRSNSWKHPVLDFETQRDYANKAAKLAASLHMPVEVEHAIQGYPLKAEVPEHNSEVSFTASSLFDEPSANDTNPEEQDSEPAEIDQRAVDMLVEVMKLAKFIQNTTLRIEDKKHFAEELVYMVSYNSSKGYFHEELVESIIKKFKEYEKVARNLMRVGEIEAQCLFGDLALAYAKPRPSQILCTGKRYDCSKVINGWNINIISSSTAFGWLGKSLAKDSYPKCMLEEQLQDLF